MKEYIINENIRHNVILVVLDDGTKKKLYKKDAIALANESEMDLICVSETRDFAVCKIASYSKMKYEAQRAERMARKNQTKTKSHQIEVSPNISDGDLTYRAKKVAEWLEKKDVVEITCYFKGRMITHQEFGVEKINKLIELVGLPIRMIQPIKLNGKRMSCKIELDTKVTA